MGPIAEQDLDEDLAKCMLCHRRKSDCSGWRLGEPRVCRTCHKVFKTIWQPDGHTLEQMETEVNKDDASKSVYLENALDFETALVFVPIAATDVPHEREPAVILRRLQGPSWGGEP